MSRSASGAGRSGMSDDLEKAIHNMFLFFSQESKAGHFMVGVHNVFRRISASIKISESTIRRVVKKQENACVLDVVQSLHVSAMSENPPPTPRIPPRASAGRPCKYDDFDMCTIRQTIYDMYRCKNYVSLTLLMEKLQVKGLLIKRSTLHRVLKKIGFRYYENGIGKRFVCEKAEVIAHRHSYLRDIQKYRADGWDIVYSDETWLNANHACKGEWCDGEVSNISALTGAGKCGRSIPSGKGKRLIIVDAGSAKHGFIDGANLVFLSKSKTGDYHDEMNGANYLHWFENQLLKRLPEPSVIVLDNATYHNLLTEDSKCPVKSDRKETIQAWLNAHNIKFDDSFIKEELMQLVKRHKPTPVYKTDRLAMMYGHFVMRLPVKHCELNPIELIQAELKSGVARRNTTFKISDVKDLFIDVHNSIGIESWRRAVEHVIGVENEFWEADGVRPHPVEPVSFNIDDTDSSSDDGSDIASIPDLVCESGAESDDVDATSLCVVCKSAYPPVLKPAKTLFVNWAQCDFCEGWVHLKTCCSESNVTRKDTFSCPSCSMKLKNKEPES